MAGEAERENEEIETDFNDNVTEEKQKKSEEREYLLTTPVNDEHVKKKGNVYRTGKNTFEVDILHPNKKKVEWINGFKEKYDGIIDETELKDGKNITVLMYHRVHPKTGERFTTQYINSYAAITWTTTKIDQFIEDEQKFHHPKKTTTFNKGDKELFDIIKQRYVIQILRMFAEKDVITIREFSKEANIENQSATKYLKELSDLGLLIGDNYGIGGTTHYKLKIPKDKIKELFISYIFV